MITRHILDICLSPLIGPMKLEIVFARQYEMIHPSECSRRASAPYYVVALVIQLFGKAF